MVMFMRGGSMKVFIQVIVGLLFLIGALYLLTFSSWLWAAIRLIQGGVVVVLFLIGIGLVLLGASELKE